MGCKNTKIAAEPYPATQKAPRCDISTSDRDVHVTWVNQLVCSYKPPISSAGSKTSSRERRGSYNSTKTESVHRYSKSVMVNQLENSVWNTSTMYNWRWLQFIP